MRVYSIRNRILIWLWGLLAFAVALPTLYLAGILRQEFIGDANQTAKSNLVVAEWLLQSHPFFQSSNELEDWMKRYMQHTGQRLSYIVHGQVKADSSIPNSQLTELDDHSLRPEVIRAMDGGIGFDRRQSRTLHHEMIYVAKQVQGLSGIPPGILRLSRPVSDVLARFELIMDGFALVFGACFVASILVTYFGMSPLMETLRSMANTAQAIGKGSYNQRIPPVEWEELEPLSHVINTMAKNIDNQINEMTLRQEKLKTLFNALTEGVIYVNKDGIVEVHNRAATTIFAPLFAGKTLLDATMQPSIQQSCEKLEQGHEESTLTNISLPNGKEYEVALVKIKRGSGEIVVVIRDVSEAKRLDKMRQDFVANVSHELKTPLTSIKGYTETLIESGETLPESQRLEFLHTILRNANHMTKMVTSLLILAKLEHQEEAFLQSEIVDLDEVIREVLATMRPLAEEKRIDMLRPDAGLSILVEIEREALHEVLRNLVDNAVKYTPSEGVISVRTEIKDKSVFICVQDSGPAIAPQDRERIFERFYRITDGKKPVKSGSAGLGLAICRRIIKSAGGDIWLETPVHPATKSGVAFCFILQRAKRPTDG